MTKKELFWCYQRGWKHGACANAKDPRFTHHANPAVTEAYRRGYEHGRRTAALAMTAECCRLGYDASADILRGPAPIDPPKEAGAGT